MKSTDWILRVVKGMFIGTGFILPGVSGGALAAIFGIYERLIGFLANLTKDFIKNLLYFVPVGIGAFVSVVLCSVALTYFFDFYMVEILWFFAGCIIGTLPALWAQAGEHGRKPFHYGVLIISAVAGYIFLFLIKNIAAEIPANFVTWIIAGAIMALGFLVPGLSPSNFLLYMGMYDKMTAGFKALDFGVLVPIGIGGLVCVLALSKFFEWLIKKYHAGLFHFILGIVTASTIMILPLPINFDYLDITYTYFAGAGTAICAIAAVLGIALGWWMSRLEEKYKPDKGF